MNHAAIVADFIRSYRHRAKEEMEYYAAQPRLADAIRVAALSQLPDGRRHSHQHRIPAGALQRAEQELQRTARELRVAKSFAELHRIIERHIRPIHKIGALAVYDITHRIGAFLGLAPKMVYLHAGTADGAKALGIRGTCVHPSALPPAFRKLTPAEIEDCLCIYANELRRASRGSASRCVAPPIRSSIAKSDCFTPKPPRSRRGCRPAIACY